MSLVTPDFGLLFWMVIIFGVVFFLLAKFGFPVITSMVRKRSDHIEESLKKAQAAQTALENLTEEGRKIIEEARAEQGRILKDATRTRDQIISQARQKAQEEADKIVEHTKIQLAAERESAMRHLPPGLADIRQGGGEDSEEGTRQLRTAARPDRPAGGGVLEYGTEELTSCL